jgi:hypothetical protein
MSQATIVSPQARPLSGWLGIGAIALLYGALYGLNYWLPLAHSNYTTRIWNWSQLALTIGACVALILKWRHLTPRAAVLGLALGVLSGLAHLLHEPYLWGSVHEGLGVWACFMGGFVLFQELEKPRIPAFQPPVATIARSLLFGIVVALPLALINNLYFFVTVGVVEMQDPLVSAFTALSPGIHEEIIFRFFVLAVCQTLLRGVASRRLAMGTAVFLAVVPHSLNHLPDLFRDNPVAAVTLLVATCLLFGLPMALLQLKRNLESAIAFHWFIDFARFLFGF